jgi:hypothetical protein
MTMLYDRQASAPDAMTKTDVLVIRFAPEDRVRLQRVADAAYLDVSAWARQLLMRAVAEAEATLERPRTAAPARRSKRAR